MNWRIILEHLNFTGSWWTTTFVVVLVVAVVGLLIQYHAQIRQFTSEVRAELLKASWPWDPKEKGFKRYKELIDSTLVVIIAMLLLSGYIAFLDFILLNVVGALTGGKA